VRLLAGVLAACLVASCDVLEILQPGPKGEREPQEQQFGPAYPAAVPIGRRLVRIDAATLSADQKVLTVSFAGSKGFLASDPCSADYEPWLAPDGDELDVAIVEVDRPGQVQLGPNTACTLVGYGHTYHLLLGEPFTGTTVNDRGGGTLFVAAPAGTFRVTRLPDGWSAQHGFALEPGPPPIWAEIYSAAPVGNDWEGPGRLVLYQAFGIVGEWSETRSTKSEDRGGHPVAVTMNGESATVWVDDASGELLVAWEIGGRSLGLIGNAADMTPQDLVSYAESVASAP